ncbi:hypothetical protein [uncultured Pseudacidovorax sp.]|uniref:hypothetical protein n=1 Tax=uncultured Pseudacidovorax sp. TaxID=679313 RepID=UPI0025DF5782|nr:hypothetical protein [uncultured Pseudacidovorax sp.]
MTPRFAPGARRATFTLVLMLGLAVLGTGCASGGATSGGSTASTGGSGVEVFGTIDAGVSGVRNKSGR